MKTGTVCGPSCSMPELPLVTTNSASVEGIISGSQPDSLDDTEKRNSLDSNKCQVRDKTDTIQGQKEQEDSIRRK